MPPIAALLVLASMAVASSLGVRPAEEKTAASGEIVVRFGMRMQKTSDGARLVFNIEPEPETSATSVVRPLSKPHPLLSFGTEFPLQSPDEPKSSAPVRRTIKNSPPSEQSSVREHFSRPSGTVMSAAQRKVEGNPFRIEPKSAYVIKIDEDAKTSGMARKEANLDNSDNQRREHMNPSKQTDKTPVNPSREVVPQKLEFKISLGPPVVNQRRNITANSGYIRPVTSSNLRKNSNNVNPTRNVSASGYYSSTTELNSHVGNQRKSFVNNHLHHIASTLNSNTVTMVPVTHLSRKETKTGVFGSTTTITPHSVKMSSTVPSTNITERTITPHSVKISSTFPSTIIAERTTTITPHSVKISSTVSSTITSERTTGKPYRFSSNYGPAEDLVTTQQPRHVDNGVSNIVPTRDELDEGVGVTSSDAEYSDEEDNQVNKAVADQGFGVLTSRCASFAPGLVSDGAGGCTKPVNRIKKKHFQGGYKTTGANEIHSDADDGMAVINLHNLQ